MNREDLEHIIRAAATVTNEYEFVIVGRLAHTPKRQVQPSSSQQ